MSTNKKLVIAVVALATALCCMVGGTLAWLISTPAAVTNTFTVGDIVITLDEAKVTEYGVKDGDSRVTENSYKLVPGEEYLKDPIVHVGTNTNEKCYIFVKVVNNITGIEDATTIATQIANNGWTALEGVDGVYYQVFDPNVDNVDRELEVFQSFTIKQSVNKTELANYNGKVVTVTAYAIQFLGMEDANAAWTTVSTATNG